MYIRRAVTRRAASGETYYTYRLVESRREGNRVRQITRLNLGRHFDLPEAEWPLLCARLEQLLSNQETLLPVELPERVESLARKLAGHLLSRVPVATVPDYAEVDVNSMRLSQPRSVGVEHLALCALAQWGLELRLTALGINAITRAMILAQIVGRMAHPGSELSTWGWLNDTSALGELLGLSWVGEGSLMRLYRAADVLLKHKATIEAHLFNPVQDRFHLEATVTLYDLTNTYFEGIQAGNPKAKRGHSKEKRTDCPLVTLGLVLDGSGFVRRSEVFAGNAVEARTLEPMLTGLQAPSGALVVMDRGLATDANLVWLRQHGYRYLVVSRAAERQLPEGSVTVTTAGDDVLTVEKVVDAAAQEVRLYCHSPAREAKERGISERFCQRFEAGLAKLADGLTRPHGEKRPDRIQERIGKLKQRSFGAGQHYTVTIETNPEQTRVTGLTWTQTPKPGSMLTTPGVYCLRSTELDWSEQRLWHTYIMLTDLEAVFRSLKSELGLRPLYHSKGSRTEAHLFISVLAYQCVQLIRRQLKAKGINLSWAALRETLSVQRRVTVTFTQKDGRTLHVRKATQPEGILRTIYHVLDLDPLPGGTKKQIV